MAGFYGLDLYNLRASTDAVVSFLERADPRAAQRVRAGYTCSDSFGENGRGYAFLAGSGITRRCKAEAVAGLVEIQRLFGGTAALDPRAASDDHFDALQSARLVRDAEAFYHSIGAHVVDREGKSVGTVSRLVLDPVSEKVVALVVQQGVLNRREVVVPINKVADFGKEVRLSLRAS